jgi:hypothetical protein
MVKVATTPIIVRVIKTSANVNARFKPVFDPSTCVAPSAKVKAAVTPSPKGRERFKLHNLFLLFIYLPIDLFNKSILPPDDKWCQDITELFTKAKIWLKRCVFVHYNDMPQASQLEDLS